VRFLSNLVPTLIELTRKPLLPFGGRMMWCVDGSGSEIDKPRLIGLRRIDVIDPADRFVRDVDSEVISLLGSSGRINRRDVAIERRVVLMRFALIEAIEVFESQSCRQRSNGPAGVISGSGVLCHLPYIEVA
jgi:hypothetical protein